MKAPRRVTVPAEVFGAIGHALELNLVDVHRRHGPAAATDYDLYPNVVAAVKWAHAVDEEAARTLVQDALTNAAAVDDGPTLERATLALTHGLTQPVGRYGAWAVDLAERFICAALIASWSHRPADPAPEGER